MKHEYFSITSHGRYQKKNRINRYKGHHVRPVRRRQQHKVGTSSEVIPEARTGRRITSYNVCYTKLLRYYGRIRSS